MTGYFERLAARANGAQAAVAPRLPSRFELPASDAHRPPDLASGVAPPPPGAVAQHPGEPDRGPGRDTISAMPRGADTIRRPAAEPVTRPAANATVERRDPTDGDSTNDRVGDPRRPERPDRTDPARARAIVAARPVEHPVDAARDRGARAPDGAAAARHPLGRAAEPDVVHVSIGRVEVRATLAAPPPDQLASRTPSRADSTVSLEDYLKGRRPR